jgi:CheY-like chemotaxis protein
VLIADIGLPDEDGYTLVKKVKAIALEKRTSIQAIALTGYAGELDGKRAIASGFQTYLTKPTEPRRLVEAIANLVRREMRAAP